MFLSRWWAEASVGAKFSEWRDQEHRGKGFLSSTRSLPTPAHQLLSFLSFSFAYRVLQNALLLSDSSLHLFLQSHLNSEDIEACVSGQTKYSVEEAIHKFALMNRRFPEEDEEGKKDNDVDYDSERYSFARGLNRHIYLTHSVRVHAHR